MLRFGTFRQACLGLSERGSVWLCKVGYGRRVVLRFVPVRSGLVRLGELRLGKAGELWFGDAGQSELWRVLVRQGMVSQARYGKLCLVGFSYVTASYGRLWYVKSGRGMLRQARRVKVSCVALCFVEVSWGMVS